MSSSDERDEVLNLRKEEKRGYSDPLPVDETSAEQSPEKEALNPRETPSASRSEDNQIPVKKTVFPDPGSSGEDLSQTHVAESFVEQKVPDFSSEIPADVSRESEVTPIKQKLRKDSQPKKQSSAETGTKKTMADKVATLEDNPQPKAAETQPDTGKNCDSRTIASNQIDNHVILEPQKPPGSNNDRSFLLRTDGLVKIYDGRTVVNGVEITVRPGEIVGLLGPNGAGKTTSFYMIVGLVPPNGGSVFFGNEDVTKLPMYQRARLGMGYLPQEESIFRKLTVEENIMAVMETLDLSKKERVERCDELLERFSITHIRNNIALTCSGGEKRRLTIARSLVTKPSLLMLDEPFSGVDPIAVNEIQSIVEELKESGLAILITDHNARQTLELVDRAYLIYEGKVLREGSRDFLINDPVSRELYLGERFTM